MRRNSLMAAAVSSVVNESTAHSATDKQSMLVDMSESDFEYVMTAGGFEWYDWVIRWQVRTDLLRLFGE